MVDAKAETLHLSVCGRDFEIAQSPGLLQSSRAGGTTGAAVWRTSVSFAEWMGWRENPLFATGVLDSTSTVLELGAGISGLLPCLLSQNIRRVVVTDQNYVLKALRENVNANKPAGNFQRKHGRKAKGQTQTQPDNISILSLDWENDDFDSFMSTNGLGDGIEAVLVCDCVFNYALIDPLVQACVDISKLRQSSDSAENTTPTVCVIAQQLRQPEVFEQWLAAFHRHFRVWRVPDQFFTDGLKDGSGFAIHIGLLR